MCGWSAGKFVPVFPLLRCRSSCPAAGELDELAKRANAAGELRVRLRPHEASVVSLVQKLQQSYAPIGSNTQEENGSGASRFQPITSARQVAVEQPILGLISRRGASALRNGPLGFHFECRTTWAARIGLPMRWSSCPSAEIGALTKRWWNPLAPLGRELTNPSSPPTSPRRLLSCGCW